MLTMRIAGAALLLLALTPSSASAQACSPNCIGGLIAFSLTENAEGPVAVSVFGNAEGELVGVSGTENAYGGVVGVSGMGQSPGNGEGGMVGVAGHGNARGGLVAASGHGNAEGFVAVSCGGHATGTVAVEACPATV